MKKKKGLALMLAAAMTVNLWSGVGTVAMAEELSSVNGKNMTVEQPVQMQETQKASKEYVEFQRMREERQKEREIERKKQEEYNRLLEKKVVNRKKASEEETAVVASMSALIKEDGTYQEAGAGSKISIGTGQELRYLSEYTAAGMNTAGVTFTQIEDIDCTGVTMSAIGGRVATEEVDEWGYPEIETYYFEGTYDGSEKKISNVTLSINMKEQEYLYNRLALFGLLSNATVENVVMDSMQYEVIKTEEDAAEISISYSTIAGSLTNSTLKNCKNYADITMIGEFDYLSGMVISGDESSTIENCINYGDLLVENQEEYYNYGVSGIASWSDGMVKECQNHGDIKNQYSANGIIGDVYNTLEECENTGRIVSDNRASGIADYNEGILRACSNKGTVEAESKGAGIVYFNESQVMNCRNTGNITGDYYAGGIADFTYGEIKQCTNQGTITGKEYGGGIIAYLPSVYLSGCLNEGDIISEHYTGGIAGYCYGGTISTCVNRGLIESQKYAGGVLGAGDGEVLYGTFCVCNTQNFGEVLSEQCAGGIIGQAVKLTCLNLWNHGNVTGKESAGGIIGSADIMAFFEEYFSEEKEESPEYYEERKQEYLSESMKNEMAITIANAINIGTIVSNNAAGAMVGKATVLVAMSCCYYQKGSSDKVVVGDASAFAEVLEKNAWNNGQFIEELNQNIINIGNNRALTMEYDSEDVVKWGTAIVFEVITNMSRYEEDNMTYADVNNYISMEFVLYDVDAKKYIPMNKNGTVYYVQDVTVGEYEIYRVMEDDSYYSFDCQVFFEEGDNMALKRNSFPIFQMITDISYQKNENGVYELEGKEPYYIIAYNTYDDIVLPEEPVREGYIFGGWYTTPYVYNEELYESLKEEKKAGFLASAEMYQRWFEEGDGGWYTGTKEEYVAESLVDSYGYSNVEEFMANIDSYIDEIYGVDDYESSYYRAKILYAKWIDPNANKQPEPTCTAPVSTNAAIVYHQPDAKNYIGTTGNYVKKAGVVYQVNAKKKTAKVTGVTSRQVKKLVVQSTVTSNGVKCKVTSIDKKAFGDCKKLKKITIKGKNLKSVHKTALKGTKKKVTIKANKKIKKLFKKALKNR